MTTTQIKMEDFRKPPKKLPRGPCQPLPTFHHCLGSVTWFGLIQFTETDAYRTYPLCLASFTPGVSEMPLVAARICSSFWVMETELRTLLDHPSSSSAQAQLYSLLTTRGQCDPAAGPRLPVGAT